MDKVKLSWPPKELSPNHRAHWTKIARVKKAYRRACALETKVQLKIIPTDDIIGVNLEFFPPKRYRYDHDNLIARMKAGLDGVADAIDADDHRFRVRASVSDTTGGYVIVSFFTPDGSKI